MNRTRLIQAVERLAVERNWHFIALRNNLAPSALKALPSAILRRLDLRSIEGKNNGTAIYDIVLTLVVRPERPAAGADAAAELEEPLIGLFTAISEEPCVVAVEQLALKCEAAPLTPHGDVAMTATARIVTWF